MKRIMAKYIHEEIKGKLKRYIDYEVIGSPLQKNNHYISNSSSVLTESIC